MNITLTHGVLQVSFLKDATNESEATLHDTRRGGTRCTNVDPKMIYTSSSHQANSKSWSTHWELYHESCRMLGAYENEV